MSADELQELREHAEHGAHNPSMAPVSLTMAILAVLVAIVSLLGHRTHTEEVVLQTKVNDQWAYYQGKDTRLHVDDKLGALAGFMATSDASKAVAWIAANKEEAEKYEDSERMHAHGDFEVEVDEVELTSRTQTTDKHGKPIKNRRYMRTFYGFQLSYSVKCSCGEEVASGTIEDETQASGMDELT